MGKELRDNHVTTLFDTPLNKNFLISIIVVKSVEIRRLMDLGVHRGNTITVISKTIDSVICRVDNSRLVIPKQFAKSILVTEKVDSSEI